MEFVRNPDYTVIIALKGVRSEDVFQRFIGFVQQQEACFTPVLGLHNCPAELEWIGETEFQVAQGEYRTKGFALRSHQPKLESGLRFNFERIPTFQDADWWNHPDRYREVIYPSNGGEVRMSGSHFQSREGDAWCLI